MEKKKLKSVNNTKTIKKLKKPANNAWVKYLALVLTVLAHIAVVALLLLSNKYYSLQMSTFIPVVIALLCLLVIIDILFYFSIKYKKNTTGYVTIGLAVVLMLVGGFGSYYVHRINKTVNTVIENDGVEQYETVYGSFVYYNKSGYSFTSVEDLAKTSGLKVGFVADGGTGPATVGQELLNDAGVSYTAVQYSTNEELLSGLVGSDEDNVDVAIFASSFLQSMANDDEIDYSTYLDNMTTFYQFEEKIKTGDNETAGVDLYSDTFNILLIGYAPENESYGLADSIILATVNPKTFTVVLTSIARDSYVEICGTGSRAKINSARGISRQCLMDTVGGLLDVDVNYYMEVNFNGVVEIVDALDGIVVSNPVEFVGQDPSTTRGEYTVLVPAGDDVYCDGKMALAFARERHAYADGDFQRQLNQQQVIARISEKLLALNDVNKALKVMDAAGSNFTTNLSLSQLTGIFNYLVNHNNTTGMSTFNMIDIQSMRVTGYASWYYSYSMMLPQWIYKLYNGSIAEAKERINDVMNNYTTSSINQIAYLKFFAEYPYSRGQLYSEYFDEAQEAEEMPAYYPRLTSMSYSEVVAWAAQNGVTLNITYITEDSSEYVASRNGEVLSYSVPYGALVANYPTCSITVMGSQDGSYDPEYDITCTDEASCKAFAQEKGLQTSTASVYDASQTEGAFAYAHSSSGSSSKVKKSETLVLYYYTKVQTVTLPAYSGIAVDTYINTLKSSTYGFTNVTKGSEVTNSDSKLNGTVASVTVGGNTASAGSSYQTSAAVIVNYYATATTPTEEETWGEWTITKEPTCTEVGSKTRTSNKGNTETATIDALGHDFSVQVVDTAATTESEGSGHYKCSRCDAPGDTYKIPKLESEGE